MLSVVTPILSGNDVIFLGDAAIDEVSFSVDGSGFLQHNLGGTNGFNSNVDLDSETAGDQPRAISDITSLTYTDSGENDVVSFLSGAFSFDNGGFTGLSVTAGSVYVHLEASIASFDGTINLSGNNADSYRNWGVSIWGPVTTVSGDISITGTGGSSESLVNSRGVSIGSTVSSNTGDIDIIGSGGDGVFASFGVVLSGPAYGGSAVVETSGTIPGSGNISIDGISGAVNQSIGLTALGATVRSVAGNITMSGHSGEGSEAYNIGVYLLGAMIESTGMDENAGTVAIEGTGGIGPFATDYNVGTWILGGTSVTTNGGDISIAGLGGRGSGNDNTGVHVASGSLISSSGHANISVAGTAGEGVSDGVIVTESSRLSTIGGDIDVTGSGATGAAGIRATGIDAGSGNVNLTAPLGHIQESEFGVDLVGGNVTFNGSVSPGGPFSAGTLVIDGNIASPFGASYAIGLGGYTAGVDYDQIQVVGAPITMDLAEATLNVSLTFTPVVNDQFTIINNDNSASFVTGKFNGLPEGSILVTGGTAFLITYQGGTDNNDVVLTVIDNASPEVDDQSFTIVENSPNGSLVGTIIATDPDLPGDTVTYAVTGGTGASAFDVNPATGEITVKDSTQLDYETTSGFSLHVVVTDSSGAFDTAEITIGVLNVTAIISGTVFVDADGDGFFDGGSESGIDGVTITLMDDAFSPIEVNQTSMGGIYAFVVDDEFGTYRIVETQPGGVEDGSEIAGSGATSFYLNPDGLNDVMELTLGLDANYDGQPDDATDWDFTELGQPVTPGDTATIGFWQNKNGQELIEQGGNALVQWLSTNFDNVFGTLFSDGNGSDDAAEVAAFYRDEFFKKKLNGTSRVDAQFMATALSTFFTSSTLAGGDLAHDYGFTVTETGLGSRVVNIGTNGMAFGVSDNTNLSIMALLLATNSFTDMDGISNNDSNGYTHVYDVNGDGVLDSAELALRAMANNIYSEINEAGDL